MSSGTTKRHIGTYVGENKLLEAMVLDGRVQLDLVPQGTFSERIRAGGAGIPAFFTPTGVGTIIAEGKEAREFDGHMYIMERALKADFAFVKAWKGDQWGNLVYRKTARNFNPMMATAARVTIAEVEHLVQPGELDPEMVHTPSVYVQRIFQGKLFEKRIERRTVRMVGLVALMACANVGSLLLVRGAGRIREMSVRYALGAKQKRVIQQLLVEGLLLGLAGGLFGMLLAPRVSAVLITMIWGGGTGDLPFSAKPDLRIMLFNCGLALLASLLFSLAPALQFWRPDQPLH